MKIVETIRLLLGGSSGYERINDDVPVSPPAIEGGEGNASVKSMDTKSSIIPVEMPYTWSAWTFTWFRPIIQMGERKVITKDDMLDLPPCLTSKEVLATFMQCWTLESLKLAVQTSGYTPTTDNIRKPKLWRVLHTMIKKEFWTAGVCRFFNDALLV